MVTEGKVEKILAYPLFLLPDKLNQLPFKAADISPVVKSHNSICVSMF